MTSQLRITTPIADVSQEAFLAYLLREGHVDAAAANRVVSAGAKTSDGYCRLLPKLGVLEERTLARRLTEYLSCPILTEAMVPDVAICPDQLSANFLLEQAILPLHATSDRITIALADPFSVYARRAVALATGRRVDITVGDLAQIEQALRRLYADDAQVDGEERASITPDSDEDGDLQKLKDLAAEAPVIRIVNQLVQAAVEMRASDIHLEPFQHQFRVRYRIDGLLRDVLAPPAHLRAAIVSRVKVMARLNIAERRLPQDGRIRLTVRGKEVDLRVSTFPTMYGESVVLRVLDRMGVALELDKLGFASCDLQRYLAVLRKPTGMVLVTGPTGSGKTTTLYASLRHLDSSEQKIFTIEDPIEYELTGINQTQVKPQVGLSFANSLRSLMRQDPDVILIGEIRDLETAEIAGQSSLTGHKVLSTLHTNDAVTAITRLLDMGVPAFLVSATLECVVAQRLVRVLCRHCKVEQAIPADLERFASHNSLQLSGTVFGSVGCVDCGGTGYHGRTAIYEILVMSDSLRGLMHKSVDLSVLRKAAIERGMSPMHVDGIRQIMSGMTTLAEVQRVTSEI